MRILSLDLGRTNKITVGIICEDDAVADRRIVKFNTTREEFQRIIEELQPDLILVEMCPTARWVVLLAESLGVQCLAANTNDGTFKRHAGRIKTDKEDAVRLLFHWLDGRLKLVHMPSSRASSQRGLTDQRLRLRRHSTASKNAIRAILEQQGIPMQHRGWSQARLDWLASLAAQPEDADDLTPIWRIQLAIELDYHAQIEAQLARLEALLERTAAGDDQVQRLRQEVPGVGKLISVTISASIDDPNRFSSTKQVSRYSGLSPAVDQSGSTVRNNGISRTGWATLRGYLVEAANLAIHVVKDPWARAEYERLRHQLGRKKKALVAVARKLYIRCWLLLKHRCSWDDLARPRRPAKPA